MQLRIGADPELFVFDRARDMFISAHDLMPGEKRAPHVVPNGAVQVDGVAAEYNIFPALNVQEFIDHNLSVVDTLTRIIQEHSSAYELLAVPTAWFDEEYFADLPEQAKLLGCEPDFNAYTGKINQPPETNRPFRTGAGHIHIGWTQGEEPHTRAHRELCCEVVRLLDDALFEQSKAWDTDETRRTLYGDKGAFRPKHYGVEYRPLSNAWVGNIPVMELIYHTTVNVVQTFFANNQERIAA